MSQQGARKLGQAAGSSDGSRCRSRSSAPKVAGDASAQPTRQKYRSKSRNKIPKSVRYDLENALVGLCNVWFEDIKPHLLRNNIKVHVHPPSGEAGATGAEGDRPTGATPAPAPPRCRHVNPGAAPDCPPHPSVNFADFCLTRPTASSAPSPRRQVSRRPALPPLLSPPLSPPSQVQCLNCKGDGCNELRKGRNSRCIKTSTHDKSNSNRAVCNDLDFHLHLSNLKRVRKKTKTKEMGSQTESPAPYSICARRHRSCMPLERPQKSKRCADSHGKAVIKRNKSTQTDLYLYLPLKTRSSGLVLKCGVRSSSPTSPRHIRSSSRVRPLSRMQSSSHVTRPSSRVQYSSHIRSTLSRSSAPLRSTSPSPRLNSSKTNAYQDIFREEFIEDIAEKRDPNVLLLYRSPRMEGFSSAVNTETVVSIQRKKLNRKRTPRK